VGGKKERESAFDSRRPGLAKDRQPRKAGLVLLAEFQVSDEYAGPISASVNDFRRFIFTGGQLI